MAFSTGTTDILKVSIGNTEVDTISVGEDSIFSATPASTPFPFDDFAAAALWLQGNDNNTAYIQGTMANFGSLTGGSKELWRPDNGVGSETSRYISGTYNHTTNRIRWRQPNTNTWDILINQAGGARDNFRDHYAPPTGTRRSEATIPSGYRNVILNYDTETAMAFVRNSSGTEGFARNIVASSEGGGFMHYGVDRATAVSQGTGDFEDFMNGLRSSRFFYLAGNFAVLNDIFLIEK